MDNIILTILASAGTSAVLYAGLFWLTKTWISERLKGAIQHEYNEKIETLKAQLKSEYDREIEAYKSQLNAGLETLRSDLTSHRFLLEAAMKSQAFSHDLFHQKRIAAVERLWASVLELRGSLSSPVFFFGILLPSEYDSVFEKDDAIAASIATVTDEAIHAALKPTSELEADRLHLGETLWFQFFIYRGFLARLASLIVQGKRRQHIPDWRALRTPWKAFSIVRIAQSLSGGLLTFWNLYC